MTNLNQLVEQKIDQYESQLEHIDSLKWRPADGLQEEMIEKSGSRCACTTIEESAGAY